MRNIIGKRAVSSLSIPSTSSTCERIGWSANWPTRRGAALALCVCCLLGCDRNLIQGRALDVQGETLPGVSVVVEGSDYQALTTPKGEYAIPYEPGSLALNFLKSGYTPGRLELTVEQSKVVEAADVTLWRLPESWGVYLVENARYQATTAVEPKPFLTVTGSTVFGARNGPEAMTTNRSPMIVCYKLPRNEARLCRVAPITIELRPPEGKKKGEKGEKGGKGEEVTVWTPVESLPATVTPIDQPEGLLLQIQYAGPLAPGCYAVHWGALEGYPETDKRMFYFTVIDPNAPPPPPPEEPADKSKKKTEAEKKKAASAPEEPDPDDSSGF